MRHFHGFCTVILTLCLFLASATYASDAALEINKINKEIAKQGLSWQAGDNPILHLTSDERKALLGMERPEVSPNDPVYFMNSSKGYPDVMDWRNYYGNNFITSVKDQSFSCGSCWAFGVIASAESKDGIMNGKPSPTLDLSEQHLVSCSSAGSCNGGQPHKALEYMRIYGVPTESCFPYYAQDIACSDGCDDWQDEAFTIKGWSWVTYDNCSYENTNHIDALKDALMEGPVPTGMTIYGDFYAYKSGIYEHATGAYEGGHAVLIIGWNDYEEAWIAKNSWGPSWGDSGFFKIKWGAADFGCYSQNVEVFENHGDGCFINSVFFSDGQVNPNNACQICEHPNNSWTPLADGENCDDGLWCNGEDSCMSGQCSVHDYPDGNRDCEDDGLWCNGVEFCNEQNMQCEHFSAPCDSDAETCDEDAQQCFAIDTDDSSSNSGDSEDDSDSGCGG